MLSEPASQNMSSALSLMAEREPNTRTSSETGDASVQIDDDATVLERYASWPSSSSRGSYAQGSWNTSLLASSPRIDFFSGCSSVGAPSAVQHALVIQCQYLQVPLRQWIVYEHFLKVFMRDTFTAYSLKNGIIYQTDCRIET